MDATAEIRLAHLLNATIYFVVCHNDYFIIYDVSFFHYSASAGAGEFKIFSVR